jgi:hypothetical protein
MRREADTLNMMNRISIVATNSREIRTSERTLLYRLIHNSACRFVCVVWSCDVLARCPLKQPSVPQYDLLKFMDYHSCSSGTYVPVRR